MTKSEEPREARSKKRVSLASMAKSSALPRTKKAGSKSFAFLQTPSEAKATQTPARLPLRQHHAQYHRPQLLDHPEGFDRLLNWFEKEEHSRNMPWRREWIDVNERRAKRARTDNKEPPMDLHEELKRRAYQVWISEIMLQQTRVETVRDYWQAWMERWPTIEALAEAAPDDVLAAWRGLGYYSRATRIHQAAKSVVQDPELQGMLPDHVEDLQRKVPGVGPYTAGAISSIVFGHAVPILDGNVARVLSRQIALYADPKTKQTTDLLWETARLLVVRAATSPGAPPCDDNDCPPEPSAIPGKWNQGLMELGSTLCTPTKPDCPSCPLQATCMAFAEGMANAVSPVAPSEPADIEDLCTFCDDIPEAVPEFTDLKKEQVSLRKSTPAGPAKKAMKQTTLFGTAPPPKPGPKPSAGTTSKPSSDALVAQKYAQQFPRKAIKQNVRVEGRLVCILRLHTSSPAQPNLPDDQDGTLFLVHQRPGKGLLASLWEFPTAVLSNLTEEPAEDQVLSQAQDYVRDLLLPTWNGGQGYMQCTTERPGTARFLGRIKHTFSHLQWDMHVCLIDMHLGDLTRADAAHPSGTIARGAQWLRRDAVERLTMGTGLRRCWTLASSNTPLPDSHEPMSLPNTAFG